MTKLEKIEEIIREYENGTDRNITADDILNGIKNIMDDPNYHNFNEDTLRIDTPAGELCAYVGVDLDNPSVGIYLMPEGGDGTIVDLAYAEIQNEELREKTEIGEKDVVLYTYADPYTEDFTDKNVIKRDDILKALEITESGQPKKNEKKDENKSEPQIERD